MVELAAGSVDAVDQGRVQSDRSSLRQACQPMEFIRSPTRPSRLHGGSRAWPRRAPRPPGSSRGGRTACCGSGRQPASAFAPTAAFCGSLLCSHRNAWDDLYLLGQPSTFLARAPAGRAGERPQPMPRSTEAGDAAGGAAAGGLGAPQTEREIRRAGPEFASWPGSVTENPS